MKIPFSLPVIDDEVIAEMHDTLTHTGWLTTGPKAPLSDSGRLSYGRYLLLST